MSNPFPFCLRFAGITIRFIVPGPLPMPDNFEPFLCPDTDTPDEQYTLELLTEPLRPDSPMVHQEGDARIYQTAEGWLHLYPTLGDENGCQVGCLFRPNGRHSLFYPASKWDDYAKTWRCGHLICGEQMLLRHNAFLLHSSLVRIDGKAVLFSGPSGAGKSTQAGLWQTHLGAEILNGDRTVIKQTPTGFTASGSIWSGTSCIYRPEEAPIAGIILLTQAQEASIQRLGIQAFAPLFSQTILNSWDADYMSKMAELHSALLEEVPVYRLHCRPDREAVELAYQTLFKKEITP